MNNDNRIEVQATISEDDRNSLMQGMGRHLILGAKSTNKLTENDNDIEQERLAWKNYYEKTIDKVREIDRVVGVDNKSENEKGASRYDTDPNAPDEPDDKDYQHVTSVIDKNVHDLDENSAKKLTPEQWKKRRSEALTALDEGNRHSADRFIDGENKKELEEAQKRLNSISLGQMMMDDVSIGSSYFSEKTRREKIALEQRIKELQKKLNKNTKNNGNGTHPGCNQYEHKPGCPHDKD